MFNKFIKLTTTKGETVLFNVDRILFVCATKTGCSVYYDEYERLNVINTLEELLPLLT